MSDVLKGIGENQALRAQAQDQNLVIAQEESALEDRELQRAREIQRVLAANRASAAARGVAVGLGSERAIAEENVSQFEEEEAVDRSQTRARVSAAQRRKDILRQQGRLSILTGVMSQAEKAAGAAGGGGG